MGRRNSEHTRKASVETTKDHKAKSPKNKKDFQNIGYTSKVLPVSITKGGYNYEEGLRNPRHHRYEVPIIYHQWEDHGYRAPKYFRGHLVQHLYLTDKETKVQKS